MTAHENPMPSQQLGRVIQFEEDSDQPHATPVPKVDTLDEANVILSKVKSGHGAGFSTPMDSHKVLIDIDLPVKLFDSSTPGHHHLYIDKEISWADYRLLLIALERCGIIQRGYLEAALKRGHTTLRLPWVKKYDPPPPLKAKLLPRLHPPVNEDPVPINGGGPFERVHCPEHGKVDNCQAIRNIITTLEKLNAFEAVEPF